MIWRQIHWKRTHCSDVWFQSSLVPTHSSHFLVSTELLGPFDRYYPVEQRVEGTSAQNLQHPAHFPLLHLLMAFSSSLGFIKSSEERPGPPGLPVSAAGPSNEKQHKTPNNTSGNEAAGKRSTPLKGQMFPGSSVLDT